MKKHRSFPLIPRIFRPFAGLGALLLCLLLGACEEPVGWWGETPLSKAEFEGTLLDQGPEGERAARFSPEALEGAVLAALTNRLLTFDAVRRAGAGKVFDTPAFSNLALWVRSQELDRNLTPRAAGLTEAQARAVAFVIDTEILFYPVATRWTNGRRAVESGREGALADLALEIRAVSNWKSLARSNLGHAVLPVSWSGVHHGHMPRVSGVAPGTVVGPVVDESGVLFLRPVGRRTMGADELGQSLRREDNRQELAQAVGRMKRAEWVKGLGAVSETEGLLAWKGGESLSRALSRASNVYGARVWADTFSNKTESSNARWALLDEFPLVVNRTHLPPAVTARTLAIPDAPGWALTRWWDGWVNGPAENLFALGRADLSNARSLGSLAEPSLRSKRERLASRAHRRLAQSFSGKRATWQQALENGRGFIAVADYGKAQWWFQRGLLASGRRPGELESLLSPRTAGDREALVWVETLGASGDPAWIPFLAARLQVPTMSDEGKVLLVESLGRLPDRGQERVLLPIYKNTNEIWGVRLMASKALERLTGRKHPLETPGHR